MMYQVLVEPAYFYKDCEMKRVWVFSTEPSYVNAVSIDMNTGEVIGL